jgi:disulfide bond formation protein DsbB
MLVNKLFKQMKQNNFYIIFIASLLAIIVAYLAEYIFALEPCSLCILERIPYLILQCIALIAIIKPTFKKVMSYFVVITAIVEIILVLYHIGIERYIFIESAVCQVTGKSCSEVSFRFMNLSMAEWNLVYIIILLYYFIKLERNNGAFTRRS